MKNIPDKIYLNLGIDSEPVFEDENVDFKELSEVTCSKGKTGCNDIEYVRKEVTDWEQRRYEIAKAAIQGLCANPENVVVPFPVMARLAKAAVDALIKELK